MPVLVWDVFSVWFSASAPRLEGIILNAHCVEVSLVNNDASLHWCILYVAVLCELVSQVVVICDHMYVYTVVFRQVCCYHDYVYS